MSSSLGDQNLFMPYYRNLQGEKQPFSLVPFRGASPEVTSSVFASSDQSPACTLRR